MIIGRGVHSPQRTQRTQRKTSTPLPAWKTRTGLFLCVLCVLCGERSVRAQEPPAPQAVSAAQLTAAINTLGDLNYAIRTGASRTVRRAPAAQAVPALIQA